MNAVRPAPVIGFVGGVGSGKSELTRALAATGDFSRIDGDQLGHAVLTAPAVKEQLVNRFGSEILDPAGEISRPQLGRLVWGDQPEPAARRATLEAIVHPVIRAGIEQEIAAARRPRAGGQAVSAVLLDAAVLFEAGWDDLCAAVVFVSCPDTIRHGRTKQARGWSTEEHRRREASQISLEEKQRRSRWSVDHSGDTAVAMAEFRSRLAELTTAGAI